MGRELHKVVNVVDEVCGARDSSMMSVRRPRRAGGRRGGERKRRVLDEAADETLGKGRFAGAHIADEEEGEARRVGDARGEQLIAEVVSEALHLGRGAD